MDPSIKRLVKRRLNTFVDRGETLLYDPQFQVVADIAERIADGDEYGCIKRPTGTGKTTTT